MEDIGRLNTASGDPPRAVRIQDTPDAAALTIVVNGRKHRFHAKLISRDELANLAFPGARAASGRILTVTYDHGPEDAPCGLLVPGRSTTIVDGQTFNVIQTDKS